MAALAEAERDAADPYSAWNLPLTERQVQDIHYRLARLQIIPPRGPQGLSRIEATRWLTWLRVYGELPE